MAQINVGLSPIPELSDFDLSFIISQISSCSGEIGNKTLEELLREAENNTPSLSWCRQTIGQEQISKPPDEQQKSSHHGDTQSIEGKDDHCTNVFKNAIDSLSEISYRVQENLSQTEKIEVSSLSKPDNLPSQGNKTFRKYPILTEVKNSTKRMAVLKPSASRETNVGSNISRQSNTKLNAKTKVDTRLSSLKSSNLPKSHIVSQATENPYKKPSVRMYTTSAATKLYGKKGTFERKPLRPKISPEKSHNLNLHTSHTSNVQGTQSRNGKVGNAVNSTNGVVKSSLDTVSSDEVQRLIAENNVLKLEISKFKELLSRNFHSRGNVIPSFQCLCAASNPDALRSPKCIRSIKESSEPTSLPMELCRCETQYNATRVRKNNAVESSYLKTRDFSAQTDFSVNEYKFGGKNDTPVEDVVNVKNVKEAPLNLTIFPQSTDAKSPISFNFDDLTLDNFIPWQKKIPGAIPGNVSRLTVNPLPARQGRTLLPKSSSKSTSVGISSAEHRKLLINVRQLQAELDTARKTIQRLRSQQANVKAQLTNQSRKGIKRSVGTQTIGLAACNSALYNPVLFHASKIITNDNNTLKQKITLLEEEIKLLKEKRLVDLRVLQAKHEEEIEILLEEKLSLSKKLDSLQTWRSW